MRDEGVAAEGAEERKRDTEGLHDEWNVGGWLRGFNSVVDGRKRWTDGMIGA